MLSRQIIHFPSKYQPLRRSLTTMVRTAHRNALILGSGQAGTPLALHLRSLGQTVCLVERSHIAGCCVNEGCTPTKTMVASGRVAYLANRAGDYGVKVGDGGDVNVDMQRVRQRKRDIVSSFRGGSEKKVADKGVDVLMGTALFVGEKEVEIVLSEDGALRRITADNVFINVGCRPSRPNVPGLDDVDQERILDSTSIQELGEVPGHLVVIGGGAIGLEFGQLVRRFGARVTIVQRGEKLLGRNDDPELADCMQGILEGEGVEVLVGAKIYGVSKSEDNNLPITISVSGSATGHKNIEASHILLATGRVPNTDSLNLAAAGIAATTTGHIQVSPQLETNIEGIYALGDVKGGSAFTHVSYDDFRIIRENLILVSDETPTKPHSTDTRIPTSPP